MATIVLFQYLVSEEKEIKRIMRFTWTLGPETFVPVHVADLVVQSQEGHGRIYGLTTLSTQTHHLQPRLMDLLG